jgi:aminoglycoside 3-N-acetyltransferase
MAVEGSDIERAFEGAGLRGARAIVHSSLRSFGYVEGGAATVAAALARSLSTVVVPTMSWGEGGAEVPAPEHDRPARNGMDAEQADLPRAAVPFDPAMSVIVRTMGAIAHAVRALPGAVRSGHPLTSWVAVGKGSRALADGQTLDDPYYPIRVLAEQGGHVVLLGVTLTSCTAIHLAEQMAGRQPFVRWARTADGATARVRVGGCSDGFDNLLSPLGGVLHEGRVGACKIIFAKLAELLPRAAEIIARSPEITVCARGCVRCLDALAGGPLD